jgi:uncharacterized protein (DUF1015 family)
VIIFCKHRMVTRLSPFRAIRFHSPNSRSIDISDLLAPPYDVLSDEDRDELLLRDPANSVRLDYPKGKTDPGAYAGARMDLERWIADGTLFQDVEPTLTVYRMSDPASGHRTTGVFGALGLEHPGLGDVLPHEETTAKDKADRLSLIRATEINTSPIWVLSTADGLGKLCAGITFGAPSAFGLDEAGVRHESWIVDDPKLIGQIRAIVESAPVVVADGHHRLETALAYESERPEANAILALVVELSAEELDVRPIHRIIQGSSAGIIRSSLSTRFELTPAPTGLDHSSAGPVLILAEQTNEVRFVMRPRPDAFGPEITLDSQRVRIALAGIDEAITSFHHDTVKVSADVRDGRASAGILLRPATVNQIRAVADARTRMPPKTTFFYPKPRTGMVFRRVVDNWADQRDEN